MNKQLKLDTILKNLDGEGFKHLRDSLNFTQEDIAWSLPVSVKTYWRWEKDKSHPQQLARKVIKRRYGKHILGDAFFDKYLNNE